MSHKEWRILKEEEVDRKGLKRGEGLDGRSRNKWVGREGQWEEVVL